MLRACDVMQTHVIAVGPLDPLAQVERLFTDEGIHGAPVVEDGGRVLGVISASDLIRAAADERDSARGSPSGLDDPSRSLETRWDLARDCAEDVMTDGVICVAPDATVSEVARTLREQQVHRVLVMAEGEVIGIISSFDLLRILETSEPQKVPIEEA